VTKPSLKQWILILIPALALCGILVWGFASTRNSLMRLRDRIAAGSPASFSVGLRFRETVRSMNEGLLRIQLTDSDEERSGFHALAEDLTEQIRLARRLLLTPAEQQVLSRFEDEFRSYLADTVALQGKGTRGIRRDTTAQLKQMIDAKSARLLALAEDLVSGQQVSWAALSSDMQQTLHRTQELWRVSLGLLSACLVVIFFLVYRAWIAPLRLELDQSRAIIDRQEKLAALGTLAAGVAHEIRNPLTAMKFRLFTLERSLPAGFSDHEDLSILKGELNRLEKIVKDFLLFARPADPDLRVLRVDDLFEEIRRLMQASLNERGIRLTQEPAPGLQIQGDLPQLIQVVMNLVQNSAESIAGDGTITLSALAENSTRVDGRGGVVCLRITDSGPGIPEEVRRRLFDPFFSTKAAGTGLGLPIASRIVEKHSGHIHFETQLGKGTTFSVVLPAAASDL
jgi:signal transduction histidine kinase